MPLSRKPSLRWAFSYLGLDGARPSTNQVSESGSKFQGPNRHLAFSTVHMIDMARALVDRSLESAQNG